MSREAFGDPPESQEAPDLCPVCGNDWHAEDCAFGKEVARRLKAERDAHRMQFALHRLWPALERAMAGLVFTADRAGEVQADMNTLREYSKTQEFECLGEPSLCTNPRGCACVPDSKPPNYATTTQPPLSTLVEQRCPLRIPLHMSAGCCTWDTFLTSFAGAWPRWFDVPPSDQQWRMAKRDWVSGNTGWEAAHNAQARAKDRVAKRQHEAWAASGAVITTASASR